MPRKCLSRAVLGLATACLLAACATTPTGRRQLTLFAPQEMARMGNAAYTKTLDNTPIDRDAALNRYVSCVSGHLTAVVPTPKGDSGRWRVTVFKEDKTINAFALPGGNIGVYTGLLKVAANQAQLAAVIGHEIGHVEAQHPNARISAQYATQTGLQLLSSLTGASGSASQQQIMSLLGMGAQVGILLPFSRAQESEADLLGLQYMARAGFDPRQAVDLWQRMMKSGGPKPPELLSTHPADRTRIAHLERNMPRAMEIYQQARARGRRPDCGPPPAL